MPLLSLVYLLTFIHLSLSLIMSTPITRTLYLIRHAESYENDMIHRFKSSDYALDLLNLLNVPALIDCPLSKKGHTQVKNLKEFTSTYTVTPTTGFLATLAAAGSPVQVIHSPLRRARMTCMGATGVIAKSTRTEDVEYDYTMGGVESDLPNVSVAESPLLLEKTPLEWLPIYGDRQLVGRITGFTKFVETDIKDVAVVVGHSQYFKKMLGMDKKFDNCDIWECYYTFEDEEKGEGAGKWEVKGRLYKGNEVGDDQGTSCAKEAKV